MKRGETPVLVLVPQCGSLVVLSVSPTRVARAGFHCHHYGRLGSAVLLLGSRSQLHLDEEALCAYCSSVVLNSCELPVHQDGYAWVAKLSFE